MVFLQRLLSRDFKKIEMLAELESSDQQAEQNVSQKQAGCKSW